MKYRDYLHGVAWAFLLASCGGGNSNDLVDSNENATISTETPDNSDISMDVLDQSDMNLSLVTSNGTEISSELLICNYQQFTGFSPFLQLELRYFESADNLLFELQIDLPFELFIENLIPAMPLAVSAGQQRPFFFSVFFENALYGDSLSDGEIEVRLDNLPDPSALSDGDIVTLEGSLLVNQFTLEEILETGEIGSQTLSLASGSVDINCEATFQSIFVDEVLLK